MLHHYSLFSNSTNIQWLTLNYYFFHFFHFFEFHIQYNVPIPDDGMTSNVNASIKPSSFPLSVATALQQPCLTIWLFILHLFLFTPNLRSFFLPASALLLSRSFCVHLFLHSRSPSLLSLLVAVFESSGKEDANIHYVCRLKSLSSEIIVSDLFMPIDISWLYYCCSSDVFGTALF